MKIVINKCWGGFGLSIEAQEWLYENKCPHMKLMTLKKYNGGKVPSAEESKLMGHAIRGKSIILGHHGYDGDEIRTCPLLVEIVEKLGAKANGWAANLKVVELPNGVDFEIDDYDGMESVHEKHRSWG